MSNGNTATARTDPPPPFQLPGPNPYVLAVISDAGVRAAFQATYTAVQGVIEIVNLCADAETLECRPEHAVAAAAVFNAVRLVDYGSAVLPATVPLARVQFRPPAYPGHESAHHAAGRMLLEFVRRFENAASRGLAFARRGWGWPPIPGLTADDMLKGRHEVAKYLGRFLEEWGGNKLSQLACDVQAEALAACEKLPALVLPPAPATTNQQDLPAWNARVPAGTVNEKICWLMALIPSRPEISDWTITQFAKAARCAKGSVCKSDAWQAFKRMRDGERLSRSDRLRPGHCDVA